jgi:hypothetical protein
MLDHREPIRIGQFSAYYGDRFDAMSELVESGVNVLAGDYLAELTMLVLKKNKMRGGPGYAAGFVEQLRKPLRSIAERGIKVITNAGGLEPQECAQAVRDLCEEVGVNLTVVAILGDDLIEHVPRLMAEGERFVNIDNGIALESAGVKLLTANAYLGAWPIVEALKQGGDIVICPRVTDASLVMAPAAWYFDWKPTDFDRLAGALWAGHAIECGSQVTGGNFSLFAEHGDLGLPGMPIAEIGPNGDSVITKSSDSGGIVNVDTVKAQLLYEVGGADYHNPDVIADLSSIEIREIAPNRVAIEGARGFAPTSYLKVSLGYEGGYRNTVTVGITGGNTELKANWLKHQVSKAVGAPETFDQFRWSMIGPRSISQGSFEESTAWLVITARDRSRERVSRANFSDPITQLGVSNIPGFYMSSPPQRERLVGVQWPCLIAKRHITPIVVFPDGTQTLSNWYEVGDLEAESVPFISAEDLREPTRLHALDEGGEPKSQTLFGSIFGTRSGDKAGVANVGVWARTDKQFEWLVQFLDSDRFRELYPEIGDMRIVRHVFSNLYALNFQLYGYLEDGVASCTRIDPQAKGVGEFIGSRIIDVPSRLLPT